MTEDLQPRQAEEVRAAAPRVRILSGQGSTGPGGYDLTIVVVLLPGNRVRGFTYLVGGATGHVVQAVPPSGQRDFWCINVKRIDTDPNQGDQRINWYIRDVGDGVSSFDQISYITSIGGNCDRFPDPSGVWLTLTQGDFLDEIVLPGTP